MNAIQLGARSAGPGHPCFIIAEAGVNHNGKLELALKLIDAANKMKPQLAEPFFSSIKGIEQDVRQRSTATSPQSAIGSGQ